MQEEQEHAANQSAFVNGAYSMLKDPLARAYHLVCAPMMLQYTWKFPLALQSCCRMQNSQHVCFTLLEIPIIP